MNKIAELSINSKLIRVRRKKQDWIKISCSPSDLMILNIEKYFEDLTLSAINLFEILVNFTLRGRQMFFSQSWLARKCGISRSQVSKILRKLEEDGFIVSNYRHMTTCLYKLSSCFKNPFIQSRLSHIFKGFRVTALLLSASANPVHATQCIIKKYNDIYTPQKSVSMMDKMGLKIWGGGKRVSPEVENLPISQESKIHLSAFPDKILNYALSKSLVIVNIENLAGYLYTVCSERCNALKIRPDWGWVNKLKDLYAKPIYESKKFMENTSKQPPVFEEEDNYSYEYPKNKKKEHASAEPRRSPEGISPMVIIERKKILHSYEERMKREQIFKSSTFLDDNAKEKLIRQLHVEQEDIYNASSQESRTTYHKEKKNYLESRASLN